MSERRYVVELTRPVPATELAAAAGQIARRLGLDVGRVVTLLKERVGPVTKPVLAAKADAIAQVFQDAGVDVAVYDADSSPDETTWPREPASVIPTAEEPKEYGYEAPPPLPPDIDRWDADDPWGGMDPWRDAAYEPVGAEEPSERDGRAGVGEEAVEAPEAEPADAAKGPQQAGDQWPLPPTQTTSVVRPAVWQSVDTRPTGRGSLRVFLLAALAVAVILLLVLQLVYRGRDAPAATYQDGLAAYRVGDFDAARRAWLGAAEGGSVEAEFMLGHMAQHGLGRPWSFREAAERYAVAAEAGLPEAQLALGELYLEGLGVQRDREAGMAWLKRAAASGHAAALLRYGEAALHGDGGGARDFAVALHAFESAAAAGSSRAADYLDFAAHFAEDQDIMVP